MNIFKEIRSDSTKLSEEVCEYIVDFPNDACKQVDEKFYELDSTLQSSVLHDLIVFMERAYSLNFIRNYMASRFLKFYFKNVEKMVENNSYSLYLLLDVFSKDMTIFNEQHLIDGFINSMYPLFSSKKEVNSDRDVAISIFISILTFSSVFRKSHDLLRTFIIENPNNPYVNDIKEELAQLQVGL